MWLPVERLAEVTSTNDVAARRWRDGAPSGWVVVAAHQTAGRGRAGRLWQDRPGSLLVSFVVAPPPKAATLVPLAAGLAVRDAAAAHGVTTALKWPNDVLADERKAAGVLVELHDRAGGDAALVIGVGIDVDWRGSDRSGPAAAWTSLAEAGGRAIDRDAVLTALSTSLAGWLDRVAADPAAVVAAYRRHCVTIGRPVAITLPGGGRVGGVAVAIDDDGRLLVDDGARRVAVSAGDVTHAGPAGA